MKIVCAFRLILACMLLCLHPARVSAQSKNELYLKLADANRNRDIQQIDRFIKEGETLWSNNPAPYLNFEMQAAMELSDSIQLNKSNRAATVTIFDNVMRKRSPQNVIDASNYFLKKSTFILAYFHWAEISTNQARLLQVATFLGEVRSRMSPSNFVIRKELLWSDGWSAPYLTGLHSPDNLPPTIPPIATNTPEQLISATNSLQSILVKVNSFLTPCLMDYCSRSFSNPTNAEFIKQVISAAHLTAEEGKQLHAH